MFAALLSDRIGADLVMLAALTACMAANIITVAEGLSGFSNEGVLTVLVLFVVAAGIQVTGGLDWYMGKLLGRPANIPSAQLRLMAPIAFVSAFLNNTPVVVVMIPIVQKWGKNVGISPSQLLVPLSFASILGGTCTLIGTSTNLVVKGLFDQWREENYPDDSSMTIGLFDLGEFGVPIALVGIAYIMITSPYLLPGGKRGRKDGALPDDDGTILLGARLTRWSPAAGRSVKRSGLRDTGGIYLVSVYRRSRQVVRVVPFHPDEPLAEGDILWFAGPAAAISDLRKIPGLVSFDDDELKQIDEKLHDRRLVQAVVAQKGPLVGKTAGQVGFRTRYGAAVIAVHRNGTRVQDHPGNIKMQGGDVLLLEAGPTFISRNTDNQHSFALISEVKDSKPPRLNKLVPAVALVVAMLAITTAGVSSLLVLGLITTIIMVCIGILSQQECRDAVNWDVYVTIASAFGIGTALTNSGLANVIADGLVSVGEALGIGYAGLYGAVYLATFLISNVVTNNAAAALMFPIALETAKKTGADPLLMSYDLMLAASASFMSPFGYTTNLLVYGPGAYKVKDFVYIGTPMQVILWIFTTAIISNTTSPWWMSWITTFAVFVVTLLVLVFPSCVKNSIAKARNTALSASEHTHVA
ncbi:hypothetical protein THAPSDRAFT_269063 [Thalassiosira pseudonana CCMP1335]|uniref:RCK C-terminal domain-containing protein n=1 Tax=Thalassiosira pseudonana TaxID=35128 RepID=B8C5P4_THAPS|nr:hypothetical protein THAPSDRAFT_269063 [Thalassiosira pseudonana CCMP1335]EED91156.1 hypothetical protein THAPSDRAFT_269063 [Thalassiosira pseudonana CCMP1335]